MFSRRNQLAAKDSSRAQANQTAGQCLSRPAVYARMNQPVQRQTDEIEMQEIKSDPHPWGERGRLPLPVVPLQQPVAPISATTSYEQQLTEIRNEHKNHRQQNPGATSGPSFAPPGFVRSAEEPYRNQAVSSSSRASNIRTIDNYINSNSPDHGEHVRSGMQSTPVAVGGGSTRTRPAGQGSGGSQTVELPKQPAQTLVLRLYAHPEETGQVSNLPPVAVGTSSNSTPVTDGSHPLGPNYLPTRQNHHQLASTPVTDGNHPLSPTYTPQEQNLPQNFLQQQRTQLQQELTELGTGRRDTTHYGVGEEGDLRAVTNDPRFPYNLHREADNETNPVKRVVKNVKHEAERMVDKGLKATGIRKPAPGEEFHARYGQKDESRKGKVKRIATTVAVGAADTGASFVPILSTVRSGLSAVNAHQQLQTAEQIAQDPSNSSLTQSIATGLAVTASNARRDETIRTVGGIVSLAASTTGAAPVVNHAISGTIKLVQTGVKISDAVRSNDRQARIVSNVNVNDPNLTPQDLNQANTNLMQLPTQDPAMAPATLNFLAIPPLNQNSHGVHDQELALNRELQPHREGHTLLPSEVSRQARMENARLRLQRGMGANLGVLTRSQNRTWTNVAVDTTRSITNRVRNNSIPWGKQEESDDEG